MKQQPLFKPSEEEVKRDLAKEEIESITEALAQGRRELKAHWVFCKAMEAVLNEMDIALDLKAIAENWHALAEKVGKFKETASSTALASLNIQAAIDEYEHYKKMTESEIYREQFYRNRKTSVDDNGVVFPVPVEFGDDL